MQKVDHQLKRAHTRLSAGRPSFSSPKIDFIPDLSLSNHQDMRLINIWTLELAEFVDPPPYAILSHRWEADEIKYEDFVESQKRLGASHDAEVYTGFHKIARFCAFLRKVNTHPQEFQEDLPSLYWRGGTDLHWAWVDTCCIDKRSSAELSESINSMWKWYSQAVFCVAHLADVFSVHTSQREHEFLQSNWFTRGWTLQELLAPEVVIFCDAEWRHFGLKTNHSYVKANFLELISEASCIPSSYLQGHVRPSLASVAQRMSWASNGVTTRPEDTAYCLFGLFEINLPLLYGEGHAAFQRLQEEIIRTSDDESIFAWKQSLHSGHSGSVLASCPSRFADSGLIHKQQIFAREPYAVTHEGIQIKAELLKVRKDDYHLLLNCVELENDAVSEVCYGRQCVLRLWQANNGTFMPFGFIHTLDGECFPEHSVAEATKIEAAVIYLQHRPTVNRIDPHFEDMEISLGYHMVGDDCGADLDLADPQRILPRANKSELTGAGRIIDGCIMSTDDSCQDKVGLQ